MPRLQSADRQTRMRWMLDQHLRFVTRTLRRAGVPASEIDDEVQRTFMIAARRLEDVERGAERQFLFQVSLNVAAHTRRRLARRREVSGDQAPERIEAIATPENLVGRKRMRVLVDSILDRMHESLRAVLVLFAFEEMNMNEIAAALGIPRGTVASRLRRARAQFREYAQALNLAPPVSGVPREDERVSWRRKSSSALEQSLLRAGASAPARAAIHAKTLVALGLGALVPPSRAPARSSWPPVRGTGRNKQGVKDPERPRSSVG
jgi:RNA polymerase sigma-70 factor, ECF subfamily